MGQGLRLLRAIVVSVAKIGAKKLAYAGGAAHGAGTVAATAVDVGWDFLADVWRSWASPQGSDEPSAPVSESLDDQRAAEMAQEIEHIAAQTDDDCAAAMNRVIDEAAPQMSPKDRDRLRTYARMFPDRVRRTLRRADDPTGRTIPHGRKFRTLLDLAEVLPPLPRFRPGEKPIYNRQLLRVLGVGAFGEVWEARTGNERRSVALKFCLGEDGTLLHEAKLAQRLNHPGIVQLLDIHERNGEVPTCLEYEFVDGTDLATWYYDRKISDEDRPRFAAEIVGELADILRAAHEYVDDRGKPAPIVHRDLKPANVLALSRPRRGEPRFKLADLGIGGIMQVKESAAQTERVRTLTGRGSSFTIAAMGAHTPLYAPPEQIAERPPHPANDIYALGVVWYQLLRDDFSAGAPTGRGWKRELTKRGVDDAHIELIERCVDTDPGERPASASVLAEQIREACSDRSGAATPAAPSPPEPPRVVVPAEAKIVPQAVEVPRARFPMTATDARQVQVAAAQAIGVPVERSLDLGGGIKLDLVFIPPGEFLMGGELPPADVARRFGGESAWFEDEHPQHRVVIESPFYLGKYPVTVGQFRQFVRAAGYTTDAERGGQSFENGNKGGYAVDDKLEWAWREDANWTRPGFAQDDKHPVVLASWNDAVAMAEWLSRQSGESARLPAEREWEYACRAGTPFPFPWGNDMDKTGKVANVADRRFKSKFKGATVMDMDDGFVFTSPVGVYLPNGFGLHDMIGNVWEWCAGWYEAYPGSSSRSEWFGQRARVARGGSWSSAPADCRSAGRFRCLPVLRIDDFGCRLAVGTPLA